MIPTLFFLLFFLLVLAWVSFGSKARFDAAAQLPLDDPHAVANRTPSMPEPSDD